MTHILFVLILTSLSTVTAFAEDGGGTDDAAPVSALGQKQEFGSCTVKATNVIPAGYTFVETQNNALTTNTTVQGK